MNLESVIDIASKPILFTLTPLKAFDASLNYNLFWIKLLALLFIRLYLSKPSFSAWS